MILVISFLYNNCKYAISVIMVGHMKEVFYILVAKTWHVILYHKIQGQRGQLILANKCRHDFVPEPLQV
jgi:hypothetical protein